MRVYYKHLSLQRLYAEHCSRVLGDFAVNGMTVFPAYLGTASDIGRFCYVHRRDMVDGVLLSDLFMAEIFGYDSTKLLRGEGPQTEVTNRMRDRAFETQSESCSAVPVILPRRPLSVPLMQIPTAGVVFNRPRQDRYFDTVGLHDASCGICAEIGFYNVLPSGERGITPQQRRWVYTLHRLLIGGTTLLGTSELRACLIPKQGDQVVPDQVGVIDADQDHGHDGGPPSEE
jgi:hypothetical protein